LEALPVSVFNQEMNCWMVNSSGRVEPDPAELVAEADGAGVSSAALVGVALAAEVAAGAEDAGAEDAGAELAGGLGESSPDPDPEPPTVKSMQDS
jgi:hypothetical protein